MVQKAAKIKHWQICHASQTIMYKVILLAEEARDNVWLWHQRVLASEEELDAAVLAESADEVGS